MGLVIHAANRFWPLPKFAELPYFWGAFVLAMGWTLGALASGTLILIDKFALDAIGLPVMVGHMIHEEFMKSFVNKPADRSTT
jgi:hypothetical protein